MRYLATLALATLFTLHARAQHQHTNGVCGTDIIHQQMVSDHPEIGTERNQADADWLERVGNLTTSSSGTEAVQVIPVVVHVMYYNFEDSITPAQVHDAIDVLNEDFSLTNSDAGNLRTIFQSRQSDVEVEFRLAKIDPQGRSTTGITYTQSDNSLGANNSIKQEINWPNEKYLNIWVVNTIDIGLPPSQGTVLGFARFPRNAQPTTDDGVVIRHDQMGRIGTAVSNGRTLTHEVGHYLNLYHTFQGGCTGGGDLVSDTPPSASPTSGCPTNRNSCNTGSNDEPDMIENYMDYTSDVCVNTFTDGQKNRVKDALSTTLHPGWKRGILTLQANLIATGVANSPISAAPLSAFMAENRTVCVGQDIDFTFIGASYDASTTYNWEFTANGQTVTASTENPTMNFTNPGTYTVRLTVTNGAGVHIETKQGYLKVYDTDTYYDNQFTATFENAIPNPTWSVFDNGDGRKWQTSSNASFQGSSSAVMPNFNSLNGGGDDILQSTSIMLDQTPTATLRFRYAWAKRDNTNQDRLTVYASSDCGETWNIARLLSSFTLNTAGGNVSSNFVPNNSQWQEAVINMNSYVGPDPVLIRFAYTSDGGNNLYIDEVRMDVGIGIEENNLSNLQVYPNPAQHTVHVNTGSSEAAEWTLMNATGQAVMNGEIELGQAELKVDHLASGVYILRVIESGESKTAKVVIQ